ncbi:MAG: hypothetical protein HY795_00080 [Desulfovibrio sp.]|jgi:hypothetical protein|nr:hypothetical protein [Desulfovibrio sp.]MBI4958547.1 hypothetical protein [Desulfovibrio sp.]
MIDYSESLERLEKALGEQYRQSGFILGTPGTSLACKVDPFYYLAIQPGFIKYLSRWAGMFPENVVATLVKTGNMLSDATHAVYTLPLHVFEDGTDEVVSVGASFILASFIDRALSLHGGTDSPQPVSGLKILETDRAATDFLFEGKTPLQALAFGKP